MAPVQQFSKMCFTLSKIPLKARDYCSKEWAKRDNTTFNVITSHAFYDSALKTCINLVSCMNHRFCDVSESELLKWVGLCCRTLYKSSVKVP